MQSKILAFHVEGNTRAELRKNIQAALVDAEINITGKDEAPAGKKAAKEEAPAKPGKKAKKDAVTLEQVKEALTALRDSSAGAKAVKKIFAKFNVKKTDDLDEDVYADVLAAAEKAMPEDEEEEEEEEEEEDTDEEEEEEEEDEE
jgi:hypothetical protein